MSMKHANPSEIMHLQPLGSKFGTTKTTTLFKTELMEAIRLVLPAGKHVAEHKAPGEITVLCLEGRVNFTSQGESKELLPGDFLYLASADPHAVDAVQDSSLLVTIFLKSSASEK